DAATTAYLVLDLTESTCPSRVACLASLPAARALLQKARAAGALVVYSMGRAQTTVLREVAPLGDEPMVGAPADKFYQTDLDDILRSRGINTLVIVGTLANGAPLYTAFQAN